MLSEVSGITNVFFKITNPTLGDFETESLYSLDSLKKPQVRLGHFFIGIFCKISRKMAHYE